MPGRAIKDWTVDYGDGPHPCTIPHAWRQDVDVRWEGPAVYSTTVEVPKNGGWLVFEGVSYAARVYLNGELALEHHGIWDAFSVDLRAFRGSKVSVSVEVVKNGGSTYSVKEALSGFLPYVFNTFGGIWRDVWLYDEKPDLKPPAPKCRVTVKGTKIFVDKKPFYLRGVLTWGWYPDLGHPNPSDEEIRREAKIAKELGFNTIKFCLWVPSHHYFEILEEEGMFAWLELPLWDPSPNLELQEKMFDEMERIVRQYRQHSNIVVWTCGCELSSNTTADFRKRLYEMVKKLTGAALVKDNSGSSEMYGGDLREYGDFYDFHPYCDLPFYPVVLDSLLIGPREKKPILLGEFNDIDVHRDLPRIKKEQPYWASPDPYLNDPGVRWEKPQLPRILEECRWADEANRACSEQLRRGSLLRAEFIRATTRGAVARCGDIAGYVITGWRDTPISSSGLLDDWGEPKEWGFDFGSKDDNLMFPIPFRRPPWIKGGNRSGWRATHSFFVGQISVNVGVLSLQDQQDSLEWKVQRDMANDEKPFQVVAKGKSITQAVTPTTPIAIGHLTWMDSMPGGSLLSLRFGETKGALSISVFARPDFSSLTNWCKVDRTGHLFGVELPGGSNILATELDEATVKAIHEGASCVFLLTQDAVVFAPYWRECDCVWDEKIKEWPFNWDLEAQSCFSGDCTIDLSVLSKLAEIREIEILINRVDTRTYEEAPIVIRAKVGKGTLVATTLRPFGGLGAQPYGVMNNPAGAHLLEKLIELAEEK